MLEHYDGWEAIAQAWREGLTPDPLLSVSEWADQYRMLSAKSASEPGRWRTSRTPYLREIMDCLSPSSPVERVVFMKGAQIGGTECGNNWIGYVIHMAPGPMMAVAPTVEMAKRNSKQRIDPLIEESNTLITRRDRNGFSFREWQKIRERNEALDCYVYARAAASLAGLDRFEERHWLELERQLGIPVGAEPPEIRMDGLFPVQPGFESPEFLQGAYGVPLPDKSDEPDIEQHTDEPIQGSNPIEPEPPEPPAQSVNPSENAADQGGFFIGKPSEEGLWPSAAPSIRRVIRSRWMR